MTKFILILIGLGALANSAIAMGENTAEVDANGDGLITIDEMKAAYPDMTVQVFAEADADNDGVLDNSEMAAAQENGLLPAASGG